MSEKLDPSTERLEGCALIPPLLLTIVICWMEAPNPPIVPAVPLTVVTHVPETNVLSWPYTAVPKFARGRMPLAPEGASPTHSAELRCALCTLALVLNDWPVVTSVIDRVNSPRPL